MSDNLNWTGERLVTDVEGVLGVAEHLHRYALACEFVKGKTVLDIASGEGYGSHLLSKTALKVTGVDISEEAVTHANIKYGSKTNLTYQVGSASAIPLEDASVDIVTSFETLEHTTEHEEFLKEIKRVLIPGGMLIMSTPDTIPYKVREPINPYHVKELTTEEFEQLIQCHFTNSEFFSQRCLIGSFITSFKNKEAIFKSYSGGYTEVKEGYGNDELYGVAYFNLAFASDNVENLEGVCRHTFFQHVPDMLNEFKGARGLMFQIKEYIKIEKRLNEIEASKTYLFANKLSRLWSLVKKKKS
jgi:ubiquinone/menaquinone biosynthesis C-methylase UbiE